MPESRRRIGITGLGPVTGFGVGLAPLWSAMCEGLSAIRRISRFDPSGFPCQIAAELPDGAFDVKSVVPKSYRKATKVMARDIELAVGGAAAAIADARLITKAVNPEAPPTIAPGRFGCHIGAGLIAADVDELTAALVTSRVQELATVGAGSAGGVDDAGLARPAGVSFDLAHWGHTGMTNLTPLWLLKYLPNMLACHVTIIHDCRGPSNTITCAEASAALSLGESMRVIQRGAADACICGGAEYKINPMGLLRQIFAGRLAPVACDGDGRLTIDDSPAAGEQTRRSSGDNPQQPHEVVRPFDPSACGSVLGEGGGIFILEALETARDRGAVAYCEVAGFAATQSHCPDTVGLKIDENGESIADAMEAALDCAGVRPHEIDAIAPLGLSIPHVDRAEAAAIRRVLGDRAAEVPLITTIPNVGNCCAGAAAIPIIVAAMALRQQTLPARMNTTRAKGLNANASPAQRADLRNILLACTGIGGQNAAIVLGRLDA